MSKQISHKFKVSDIGKKYRSEKALELLRMCKVEGGHLLLIRTPEIGDTVSETGATESCQKRDI